MIALSTSSIRLRQASILLALTLSAAASGCAGDVLDADGDATSSGSGGGSTGSGSGGGVGEGGSGAAPTITQVALGSEHSCARLDDGTARCWGFNGKGQIGDGTTDDRSTPAPVAGLSGATKIVAGSTHTCALLADGTVSCWGDNTAGQLGRATCPVGAQSPCAAELTAAPVAGLSSVVDLAAGARLTCAVEVGGSVMCWGAPDTPAGSLAASPTPVLVAGLTDITEVALGQSHACARNVDGWVSCLGDNTQGQVGDGVSVDTINVHPTPIAVANLGVTSRLALGGTTSCALSAGKDGSVSCWGWGTSAKVGSGGFSLNSALPVPVPGLAASRIAVGGSHRCAVTFEGGVRCWGWNNMGQVGDGTTQHRIAPVVVPIGAKAVEIAAGYAHSCALDEGGGVWCWGKNVHGQLGNGTTVKSAVPVHVGE